jgi:hypothetical protein
LRYAPGSTQRGGGKTLQVHRPILMPTTLPVRILTGVVSKPIRASSWRRRERISTQSFYLSQNYKIQNDLNRQAKTHQVSASRTWGRKFKISSGPLDFIISAQFVANMDVNLAGFGPSVIHLLTTLRMALPEGLAVLSSTE